MPVPDERQARGPSRRGVLKLGACLAVVVAGGGSTLLRLATAADARSVDVHLYVAAGLRTMIDGRPVRVVGFGSTPGRVELPGARLEVEAGDTVTVAVTNADRVPHDFTVPGVVSSGPVAPGRTVTTTFVAPAPGTYAYRSTLQGDVERTLGLYGPMLVYPRGGLPGPGPRPLPLLLPDDVAAAANGLFPDALQIAREYTWVLSELDSRLSAAAATGPVTADGYLPDYFLINGMSGVLAIEDESTGLHGSVGDRTLLRMVNMGLLPRSIHVHGNHVVLLTHVDAFLLGSEKDTVRIPPGGVADVLVPFVPPPDAWPPVRGGQQYPVHDHIEMSQTANGGLYPSGMISELHLS